MKMSFKQIVCLTVFSVLLYFLSLYGWIPEYGGSVIWQDEAIPSIIILLVSIIEDVVFAFSLFHLLEFLMEKKREKSSRG